ncbi:unnamed protein product [Victoria cruziana]
MRSKLGGSQSEMLEVIEEMTNNVDGEQEKVLAHILSINANTEYLQRHGLAGRTDRQSFTTRLPIIVYEDIRPEIHRMANGDPSPILTAVPLSHFICSSGTSGGERKLLPLVEGDHDRYAMAVKLIASVMNRHGFGLKHGKALEFMHVRKEWETSAGIPARLASTSWYKSKHFLSNQQLHNKVYTSPLPAIHCTDMFQSMYSQLLAGLVDRLSVVHLGAIYALGLVQAIRFLERHYQDLAADLEQGTVDSRITDKDVRTALESRLVPDPENAAHIRNECGGGRWKGILRRIWPNARYLAAIATGSMSQYVSALEFYSDGLPLVSLVYASCETFFGINMNPLCKPEEIAYTILPNLAYFEFLPMESPESELVKLADVEMGKEYEAVVTTYSGLYRYKVGDILRVTGFYNRAPQFKFVCRKDVALNIDVEKTSEADLQWAVAAAAAAHLAPHDTRVEEFTSYADTNTIPGHYVVYWELSRTTDQEENLSVNHVMEQCCLTMEESLHSCYREMRVVVKSIGPLEIKLVKDGTFDRLMDLAVSNGASAAQYKTPRCIKSGSLLQLLNAAVVSAHFSPRLPCWSK